jgi:hypothetical protein
MVNGSIWIAGARFIDLHKNYEEVVRGFGLGLPRYVGTRYSSSLLC